MFCKNCFVQYSQNSWLLETNARNTRAYCEFFVFSSVFRCVSGVLCVLWKYCKTLAKHRKTPAKHHKTPAKTTKHHKTHSLTKQPEFANKPALAPSPQQQPARSSSHRHEDTTPTAPKKGVGPVDGPPQPIWTIIGPPKLAPEGGPGPGRQSKGTWTLVLARPHGVETKFQKIRTTNHRARCGCGVAARRSPTASRRKGGRGVAEPIPRAHSQAETTVVAKTTYREG